MEHGNPGDNPGPIDNSVLFEPVEGVEPLEGLSADDDYAGLNEATWRVLVDIYGGGPCVCRAKFDIYSEPLAAAAERESGTLDGEEEGAEAGADGEERGGMAAAEEEEEEVIEMGEVRGGDDDGDGGGEMGGENYVDDNL